MGCAMSRLHGRRDGPNGQVLDWIIDYVLPSSVQHGYGSPLWLTAPADFELSIRGLDNHTAARVAEVAPDAIISYSSLIAMNHPVFEVSGIHLTLDEVAAIANQQAGPLEVLLRRGDRGWKGFGYRLVAVPDSLLSYYLPVPGARALPGGPARAPALPLGKDSTSMTSSRRPGTAFPVPSIAGSQTARYPVRGV
jgi:hypothetical protein